MNRLPSKSPESPSYLSRVMEANSTGLIQLCKYAAIIYGRAALNAISGKPSDFHGIAGQFAQEITPKIQSIFDVDIKVHGEFEPLREGENAIIASNHPHTRLLFPWAKVMSEVLTPHLVGVAKSGHLKNPMAPIFGWLLKVAGIMIPVDRKGGIEDLERIRENILNMLLGNTAFIVMVDEHRPKPKRIISAQEKWNEKYPEDQSQDWLHYTCFPKSGGLMTALSASDQLGNTRILNSTVGCSEDETSPDFIGSTIHINIEELDQKCLIGDSSEPRDQVQHLRLWLREEWMRKNRQIAQWREKIDGSLAS